VVLVIVVVLLAVEVVLEVDTVLDVGDAVETVEEPDGALPAFGPAIEVVMGACSTKIPDQYQSSGAGLVPPFGRRRTPMCQSAELVEVLADLGATIWVRALEPVENQRPTVLAEKSMS